ncbi:MAG TPA: peptidase [Thermoanaerobaculia bacterium]|nr:peptidase [Thermoanaerobaculia bacterium]
MRTKKTLLPTLALLLLASTVPAGAVNIVINNVDPPGVGFNDPTPVAAVGGNGGTTLGQQRLNVFQTVADVWGKVLDGSVTVVIQSSFQALTCSPTSGVLGQAGSIQIFSDFSANARPATWYHAALANQIAGTDLTPGPFDPGFLLPPFNDDIVALFNSRLDNDPGCLGGIGWYYGFDGNHGAQIALFDVVLHEIGHGLGFANFVNETTGANTSGLTDIYSTFTRDIQTGKFWSQITTDAERATSARNCSNIVWDGPNTNPEVPRYLAFGLPSLTINTPAAIAGVLRVGPASFGPALAAPGITGNVVLADDGVGVGSDACTPLVNGAAVAGNIALVDRGICTFNVKVANAQAAGATAVLVADNVVACPPGGLGGTDPTILIPSARIPLTDGNAIKANLAGGVNVTLGVNPARLAGADAAKRVQLFATNPVQSGSSISHFDNIATPNLTMEPAYNADLHGGLDLTPFVLVDEGWKLKSVVIDGCNTRVPNRTLPDSTGYRFISEVIDRCAAGATNHGQFVSCVNHAAKDLRTAGFLTQAQRNALQHCAGEANIPPHGHDDDDDDDD